MARPYRSIWSSATESNWGCVNAKGCFADWNFACASREAWWRKRTQSASRPTKKLRKMAKNPTIDLWAMDQVRFQQYGSRCRMWVPPEILDPVLLHYPTRKSVG